MDLVGETGEGLWSRSDRDLSTGGGYRNDSVRVELRAGSRTMISAAEFDWRRWVKRTNQLFAIVALLLASAAVAPGSAYAQEPGIRQLDWLIGEWTFEDVQIDGEYREVGTRVCEYTLGGDYIVCRSRGVNHRQRERQYVWYFNYNADEERFEITSLFQGYAGKALYTATLHDGGRRLEVTYGSWEGEGIVVEGGATVTYDGADRYVWENPRFRDVVTRR